MTDQETTSAKLERLLPAGWTRIDTDTLNAVYQREDKRLIVEFANDRLLWAERDGDEWVQRDARDTDTPFQDALGTAIWNNNEWFATED